MADPVGVGAEAPGFSLPPGPGPDRVTLSELRGQPVVLLFVPLAFSSTCTAELCHIAENWSEWGELGAKVFGISADSPFVTKRWAEEMGVPFPILSDFNREAIAGYGVRNEDFFGLRGVAKRSAFVVDEDGIVRYAWVSEDGDALPPFEEVREAVAALT